MFGKILKLTWNLFWVGLMIFVVGMLAFRFYTLNHYPSFAEGIVATDKLKEGYKDGNISAITWRMPMELDEEGYFFVHEPIYCQDEKTLIITIRYNDNLLNELGSDKDGENLLLYPSLSYEEAERKLPLTYTYGHAYGLYSYRRYVFENVELSEYEHLYLNIHLEEDYESSPFVILDIYDSIAPTEEYKLSKKDIKALLF
ncbi:MAG: hypothetical protein E7598_03995 [Ruminococcaceae bacterium]|nr:hypothetical protein [Oscillospiraceae bacterium]